MHKVETGVHGALRINVRLVDDRETALKLAERWARSNSIGSYWAVVTHGGEEIASFNLKEEQ